MDDPKKAVQAQFGKNADLYVKSRNHAQGPDLKKLVSISGARPDQLVLDVATGGGHVANALAPLVKKVIALDFTRKMLEAARTFIEKNGHFNVEFVQGDAENLPFDDAVFHLATCRIAAHHFPNVKQFLAEAYRVLKPGGKFLLVDNIADEDDEVDRFYNDIEKRRDFSHYRAWKRSEWLSMLKDSGFIVEECHTFSKTFDFDNWFDRMNPSPESKKELTAVMLQASPKIKAKLKIIERNGKIRSFEGKAVLLKAVKPA
ncbi:MAG: methyltransferase domain-containing protein [Alicyclobacillaceae bacterium]|nr:methyltransferase domain-containing protein [Alicyclobacillaceae bacterium]